MVSRKIRSSNGQLGKAVVNARYKALKKHSRRDRDGNVIEAAVEEMAVNVDSVTHQNDLDAFLNTAQLAGTQFTAERYSGELLDTQQNQLVGFTSVEEGRDLKKLHEKYEHMLTIPRRPVWEKGMDVEVQKQCENDAFLQWRKQIAELQEISGLHLTPFERNLELWKQLWRVVERSDLIVHILDARNPLLFRCKDLEKYIQEVDPRKKCLLLINKADLLSTQQRIVWAEYLTGENVQFVFFSALEPTTKSHTTIEVKLESKYSLLQERLKALTDNLDTDSEGESGEESEASEANESHEEEEEEEEEDHTPKCMQHVYSVKQLLALLSSLRSDLGGSITVGMVGYPNVGKSSTINRIIGQKKVAVSETPGKTRHLQTLPISDRLTLCDCPGLVMPSLALSQAEMIVNAILPVDHMRDCYPPIRLLLSRISIATWQQYFHVTLPSGDLSAHDLLTAVAFIRGFMSSKGVPDCSRAGRLIVKSVICGSLCWVEPPPSLSLEDAQSFNDMAMQLQTKTDNLVGLQLLEKRKLLDNGNSSKRVDTVFFESSFSTSHKKNAHNNYKDSAKKHNNRNKKTKLKNIYTDMNP